MGVLYPSHGACTLKVLDLNVILSFYRVLPLSGLCEELEASAGHNMLEVLSLEVPIGGHASRVHFIGSIIRKVGKVLVKPGGLR